MFVWSALRPCTAFSMEEKREILPLISKSLGVRSGVITSVAARGTGLPRSVNLKSDFKVSPPSSERVKVYVSLPMSCSNLCRLKLPCSATAGCVCPHVHAAHNARKTRQDRLITFTPCSLSHLNVGSSLRDE